MKSGELDTDREIEWRGKGYAFQKVAVIPRYFVIDSTSITLFQLPERRERRDRFRLS